MHLADIVPLANTQICAQGQVGHANDGVHGCSYLMTHVGQEFTLGLGRCLCAFLSAAQLNLGQITAFADQHNPPGCHAGKKGQPEEQAQTI